MDWFRMARAAPACAMIAFDESATGATMVSNAQRQTASAFGYQWQKTDAFDSPEMRARHRAWLIERYGDVASAPWWASYGPRPKVLDAGCGAGLSAIELLGPLLHRVDYHGVDLSDAYRVAERRFAERGYPGTFERGDITNLRFADASFDVAFSEGVLHHTDSTEAALKAVARKIKPGGRFLFYVYRKKGPIREFTDDFIRYKLQGLSLEEAWQALYPLTKLGKLLGDLNVEIDIPEPIDLLEIPAGKIDLQRFIYWHVFKAFHDPTLSLDELNHMNFDWYAPKNAHRQTLAEVRQWCAEAGLAIERQVEEPAGITVIAVKGDVGFAR
jgi:SAM-dependent methyltransferase